MISSSKKQQVSSKQQQSVQKKFIYRCDYTSSQGEIYSPPSILLGIIIVIALLIGIGFFYPISNKILPITGCSILVFFGIVFPLIYFGWIKGNYNAIGCTLPIVGGPILFLLIVLFTEWSDSSYSLIGCLVLLVVIWIYMIINRKIEQSCNFFNFFVFFYYMWALFALAMVLHFTLKNNSTEQNTLKIALLGTTIMITIIGIVLNFMLALGITDNSKIFDVYNPFSRRYQTKKLYVDRPFYAMLAPHSDNGIRDERILCDLKSMRALRNTTWIVQALQVIMMIGIILISLNKIH